MGMASAKIINYILYRRFVTVFSRTNMDVFPHFGVTSCVRQNVWYCTQKSLIKDSYDKQQNEVQLSVVEVVKRNTKSVGYFCVVIIGLGLTSVLIYIILYELFSSNSPSNIQKKALDRCIKDPRVGHLLGEPVKPYMIGGRRGRRNMSYATFVKDGTECIRMKFYIQGIRRRGSVYLEVQKNESGDYEYNYLHVIADDISKTYVRLEDNYKNNSYSDMTEIDLS
ncbi:mitochondrial import inner membrane translocase subunit Tim21 isoform X3 [Ptiloglossa arizonensis]|uniref:mitochondrial import inner membrane translocase subunit Tim21 isoform X2 n=1 Tax=Ptiloglossa arizonensis TaxID=3350558 RepID=UPI003F9F5BF3